MAEADAPGPAARLTEGLGRGTLRGIDSIGYGASLLWESLYWIAIGRRVRQPVRAAPVFEQMMETGIRAIPIVSVLSLTIGIMLALQGINALEAFGAEHQVTIGVSLSVTREFAPLITGILVAGRSGSALAARLATMTINSEVDALRVMGINPVRYLVAPSLAALVVMVPTLALFSDFAALFGAGAYITSDLGITWGTYFDQTREFLETDDVLHGLAKAAIFGALIAIVGVVNGASVKGGAEGVGRVTTSSVVQGISAIVLADMLFVFATTR